MKTPCYCRGRGWWENEFLDQLYCECPAGKYRKQLEDREGARLPDEVMAPFQVHDE